MAKITEYRELDLSGLKNALNEVESEFFDLKFQAALSKLENVCLLKQKRRDIAKIKTVMQEKSREKVKS